VPVGALRIKTGPGHTIPCEVVGFSNCQCAADAAALAGVGSARCRAVVTGVAPAVRPCPDWLGRVVDGMGESIVRQGTVAARAFALSVPQCAAARACAARRRWRSDLGMRAL
jgi:flagellar biosynthesis/type III secretory pathway ATPase